MKECEIVNVRVNIIDVLMASLSLCTNSEDFNMWLNICYRKSKVIMDIQSISRFVFYRHNITECSLG